MKIKSIKGHKRRNWIRLLDDLNSGVPLLERDGERERERERGWGETERGKKTERDRERQRKKERETDLFFITIDSFYNYHSIRI